ncbi:extensin-like domain-containing protein [Pararhizobium haloflavum]|uniref:extensin-like domain-containing protein n=1 Tax=Pararhizobium haloflavum TaxID=2037914 RepID=UPI000C18365F|nr:extensin family protein [Pararhizobium haloflavum]
MLKNPVARGSRFFRCAVLACMAGTSLCLSSTPPSAQEARPPVPEEAPVPAERPDPPSDQPEEPAEKEAAGDDEAGEASTSESDDTAKASQSDASGGDDDESETVSPPPEEDAAALRVCRAALRGLGATFERGDPILPNGSDEAGCGVAAPFTVSQILPDIELEPETQMRCEVALNLARWVKKEVLPAAAALDLGPVTALNHGSTYVCRSRNNIEDAKISEHAKGNAVDIMSFAFEDGTTIAVSPKEGDGDAAEAFQKAVGSGACLYFTTVLGPGSDPYHDDHLHLDIAQRNGGFRLCQAP